MIFNSLKDKCNYYRELTDYRLLPNAPIIVMIDGKNFSKLVKNKFEKPFDDWFIETMNKTAEHLCKNIQNCVCAFVQSDEISIVIRDCSETSTYFDGRVCKIEELRQTRSGRNNIHLIVANNLIVSEGSKKLNSYIPCIGWGDVAVELSKLKVNTPIKIYGALHSREYRKTFEDGSFEIRVAHECVIDSFELI